MAAEARAETLQRIRAANAGPSQSGSLHAAAEAWELIPRDYRGVADRSPDEVIELLMHRLRDYDAEVELATRETLTACIHRVVDERGCYPLLVAAGFPLELVPLRQGFVTDNGFPPDELDGFSGVLTSATLAIAETGTLVLQNVPGQGRRAATLVPDFHLCVLDAADVVATVPQAIERLNKTAYLPTTFVSGPSATADIEMTRIKGVHGPRFLHVLIVDSGLGR